MLSINRNSHKKKNQEEGALGLLRTPEKKALVTIIYNDNETAIRGSDEIKFIVGNIPKNVHNVLQNNNMRIWVLYRGRVSCLRQRGTGCVGSEEL